MQKIVAEEFYSRIHTPIHIIDVRTSGEYSKGHIENSVSVPLDILEKNIDKFIPEKSEPVYVYCFSGSRSAVAGEILEHLGYTRVFDLDHGLLAWRVKKYPLITH